MRTVCFRVGGREFSIERHAAAIFATNLDKLSTGKLGDYGRAGARGVQKLCHVVESADLQRDRVYEPNGLKHTARTRTVTRRVA